MKTKKLIAILTLVALMMGLVPMAAFAATNYSAAATLIEVNKTSATVNEYVTFTLIVRNSQGLPVSGQTIGFYVKASSDAVTVSPETAIMTVSSDSVATDIDKAGIGYEAALPAGTNTVSFSVTSSVAGNVTISLYDEKATSSTKSLISNKTYDIAFTADPTTAQGITLTAKSYGNELANPTNPGTLMAGLDLVLEAKSVDKNGNGVAGQTVTFYKKLDNGLVEPIGTATTNALGKATIAATQTKAGKYEFTAKVGTVPTKTATVVYIYHGQPYSIEAVTSGYAEKDSTTGLVPVKFVIKDAFGNPLGVNTGSGVTVGGVPVDTGLKINDANALTAVVYTAPEGSKLTKLAGTFSNTNTNLDPANRNKIVSGADNALTKGQIIFNLPADKEGNYTIVGSITGTGITAITNITVGKFGEVKSISIAPTKPILKHASVSAVDATGETVVTLVDVNGIQRKINASSSATTDFVFSSSNVSLIEVNSTTGALRVVPTLTSVTGVATITVLHKPTGLTASTDVYLAGPPADLIVTPSVTDKTAKVSLQLVDSQGNKTYYDLTSSTNFNIIAPEGVSISDVVPLVKGEQVATAGTGSFTATSTEAGPKTFTVVTDKGLAKTFTINFATPESDIPGARNINMYIGAKGFFADGEEVSCDVAPFIGEGNRTFVELRNLANAMGVANEDITYENGVITLSRADMTLVLTIGSNAIQKTVDGVTTTITSDVAPYVVAEAGRTVLPLRAVGEAFGYTVNYNAANQLITISR